MNPFVLSSYGGDMSFFKRAHDIVQAKANRALDHVEDPSEMLDLSYDQMLEQITKVRAALVQIAASRKQLELQEDQFVHTAETLGQQAARAVQMGHEDLAREALSRRAVAQQQVDALEPQHQQLLEQERKMTQTLQALQLRVSQFRTQKETLKAQYSAARASSAVNDQIAGIAGTFTGSNDALARAQEKIASAQAHAGALDELLRSGVLEDVGADHGDDIARQLNELSRTSEVEAQLAALKAQAGLPGAAAPAALGPAPAATAAGTDGNAGAGAGSGDDAGASTGA
ncbi:MAG TPA: PspA/IM30 family protein [Acidimicrobiales bacterium]|nr:PspA/IM30 family protein [Acidimicrobiales bacterium]